MENGFWQGARIKSLWGKVSLGLLGCLVRTSNAPLNRLLPDMFFNMTGSGKGNLVISKKGALRLKKLIKS